VKYSNTIKDLILLTVAYKRSTSLLN